MKKISVIIILISFLGIIVIIANNRYDQINSVLKNRIQLAISHLN